MLNVKSSLSSTRPSAFLPINRSNPTYIHPPRRIFAETSKRWLGVSVISAGRFLDTVKASERPHYGQLHREHLAGLFSFFCPQILRETKKAIHLPRFFAEQRENKFIPFQNNYFFLNELQTYRQKE
jgi:hypothetical protein